MKQIFSSILRKVGWTTTVFFVLAGCFYLVPTEPGNSFPEKAEATEDLYEPYDFLFHQRSYPDTVFDFKAYLDVMHGISKQLNNTPNARLASTGSWNLEGPSNIGGRINCVACVPTNPNIIYAGCATGGIFKTVNGGTSWSPIFDSQPFLSIGCITLDPVNPSVIWAGTGDPNISGYPFIGDGIYKSIDGGVTWTNMGLANTHIISKIVVDPNNSNIVYAATMGLPFARDTNRGLYKSIDGGLTWNQVLFVAIDAGIIDLQMNPANTQVLYAVSWNRIRNSHENVYAGPDSKIWKSINGGTTWTVLAGGLPAYQVGRIGIAMSSINPNTLFALVSDSTHNLDGIYKTINAGVSWSPVPTFSFDVTSGMNGFGWYFGKIYVNPTDDNQLYVPGVELQMTMDGGNTWTLAMPPWWTYQVHADGHAMQFLSGNTILYATDGGLYKTTDNCVNWTDIEDIPNTQFYRVTHNPFQPANFYGGAQDNGTTGGNSTMMNAWPRIFGGDGFQAYFDPLDSNLFYVETQNGNIQFTDDGGMFFQDCTWGIDTNDRQSWDMPYVMGPLTSSTLHCGTYRVYEMTGAPYGSWTPISGDLTDGIIFAPRFHVISALSQSSLDEDILYAGTSDGNVWVTQNNGLNWTDIDDSLPDRYVTAVQPSPNFQSNVYVTHSGYKANEYIPHVHKSANYGATWTDISGDLPQAAVNDILIMPGNESTLFIATDAGVYYTVNGGTNWLRAGNNMPVMPVYDIHRNPATNKLMAGTFARSVWSIDIPLVISGVSSALEVNPEMKLFPNPAIHNLNIELNGSGNADITVEDIQGKNVLTQKEVRAGKPFSLDVSGLPAGVYFIRVRNADKNYCHKFLKL